MHKLFRIVFLILCFIQPLSLCASYERPAWVDEKIWNAAAPYFLPENHPIKKRLDKLFTKARVSSTLESLKRAGFRTRQGRKWDNVILCKHKVLKGYVLKVYTDNQMGVNEHDPFLRRVKGSNAVRKAIEDHGWKGMFKVPRKWIYPLPENPAPKPEHQRKNFILVAEDMHVLSNSANEQRWFGSCMTGERLAAIFVLIKEVGLADSVFPDNIPFCRDGKTAFIDTEHYHTWPINYQRLLPFLSEVNKQYWLEMIAHDGP